MAARFQLQQRLAIRGAILNVRVPAGNALLPIAEAPPRPYGIRLPLLPLCGADGQGDRRPRAPGVALSPAVCWFVPSASWVPRNRMQVTCTGSLTWWGASVGPGDPNCYRPRRGGRAPRGRPGWCGLRAGTLASGSSLWWSSSQTLPSGVLPRAQGSPHVGSRGVQGGSSVHGSHAHTQLTLGRVAARAHSQGRQRPREPGVCYRCCGRICPRQDRAPPVGPGW